MAYKPILWPTPGFKEENLWQVWVVNTGERKFCVQSTLLRQRSGGGKNDEIITLEMVCLAVKVLNMELRYSGFKIFIFTYPLTARVVGAPQMTSQPVSSIFPCSLLPSGTWCPFPEVVFLPLPLSALSSSPFRYDEQETYPHHFSLRLFRSEGLPVIRLPARSWHGLPR